MIPLSSTQTEPFIVSTIDHESQDVYTLNLKHKHQSAFSFKPGQFNMLYAFGVGEAAISISSDPVNKHSISHTIRAVGSVTNSLKKLKSNDIIVLRGPFGTPWPLQSCQGKSILMIAGGIGLAPMRSLIYALSKNRHQYNDISLIYGARSPQDLIYRQEFSQWEKTLKLHMTVDHALTSWAGHIGVVTQLIPRVVTDPKNTIVMLCGPEIMMRFCYYALIEEQILPENIYLSMERNMQCATGHCGHCQWGPFFICKDGPVMNFQSISTCFFKKEL